MEISRTRAALPWLLSGAVNFLCFLITAVYLSQVSDGMFTDVARSAVVKIYAVLATMWTAVLGFAIWGSAKLAQRTRSPSLTFFGLLAGLDVGMVTATNPGIWKALWSSNPYWSAPWGYWELAWLVGSTGMSGLLYWFIRDRSFAQS